ncbi:MAG TPA: hypothetical protein VNN72_16255 [Polyangiaceae bacterium]|nr:hypothetical protein [Polyangiaceae bacterium]
MAIHHVLAKNAEPQTVSWNVETQFVGGSSELVPWDMKLTPHIVATSPVSVRLEVDIAGGTLAHTTVVLRDQQTVILEPTGNPKPTSTTRAILAVTPYVLRDDADVRRLLECKRQAAMAARLHSAARPGEPQAIPPR